MWVGKFETTGSITNGTTASLTILPNAQSVGGKTVKVMYDAVRNTMQGSSTYGFTNDNDIHMMKNTEWGAVTYLSHSKYGKYGNPIYEGTNKEIYINNSSGYYTGRSGGRPAYASGYTTSEGCFAYDGIIKTNNVACNSSDNFVLATGESVGSKLNNDRLSLAYGASTTGNIYGIYDMSGGAWDYVMGIYKPDELSGISDSSGYSITTTNSQYENLTINSKYYDRYLKFLASEGYIKGDATYEVSGWYSGDYISFVNASNPWLLRGGSYGDDVKSGAFSFINFTGTAAGGLSLRVVLLNGAGL